MIQLYLLDEIELIINETEPNTDLDCYHSNATNNRES